MGFISHRRLYYSARMSDDPGTPMLPQASANSASDPQFHKQFEAVLCSWADATTSGNSEQAMHAAIQALVLAGEEASRNPSPSLLLKQEAADLEAKGEWADVEIVRRKVLKLEESSGNLGGMAKAQMDLSRLLRAVGRLDEATRFAGAAIDSARRLKVFPVLVMALEIGIACALDQKKCKEALAGSSESLQVTESGKIYNHIRARALVIRARCLLAHGDPAAAATDLAASRELLPPQGAFLLPGPSRTLANWWEVKSELEQQRGNLEGAGDAITRAVACRRQFDGPFALLDLSRALTKLGEITNLGGDSAKAQLALNEANDVRDSLHLPRGLVPIVPA